MPVTSSGRVLLSGEAMSSWLYCIEVENMPRRKFVNVTAVDLAPVLLRLVRADQVTRELIDEMGVAKKTQEDIALSVAQLRRGFLTKKAQREAGARCVRELIFKPELRVALDSVMRIGGKPAASKMLADLGRRARVRLAPEEREKRRREGVKKRSSKLEKQAMRELEKAQDRLEQAEKAVARAAASVKKWAAKVNYYTAKKPKEDACEPC